MCKNVSRLINESSRKIIGDGGGGGVRYLRMPPAFAAGQTFVVVVVAVMAVLVRRCKRHIVVADVGRRARQTVKSFGGVEIELISADQML